MLVVDVVCEVDRLKQAETSETIYIFPDSCKAAKGLFGDKVTKLNADRVSLTIRFAVGNLNQWVCLSYQTFRRLDLSDNQSLDDLTDSFPKVGNALSTVHA